MLGIIELIFLSAFLGYVFLSHKSKKAEFLKNSELFKQRNKSLTNPIIEDKIYRSIFRTAWDGRVDTDTDGSTLNYKKIVEEVPEKDWVYIFGKNYRSRIDFPILFTPNKGNGRYAFNNTRDLAINVWLSNRGYVSTKHTQFYSIYHQYLITGVQDGEALRAIRVINRNIHEHHPDEYMVRTESWPDRLTWRGTAQLLGYKSSPILDWSTLLAGNKS